MVGDMRRTIVAAILSLCALPATAQDLRGQWHLENPKDPTYVGIVLVDAEGRITLDSPKDSDKPIKLRGYVARGEAAGVKFVITGGKTVVFGYCAHETVDTLHCYFSNADGTRSPTLMLKRVGPGPKNLMRVLQ